jgi:SAM-dependent methyltransferase
MSEQSDQELAKIYGGYAGFHSDIGPAHVDYYGENPDGEVQRLLDVYGQQTSHVLDIGCGAGQTLCRLAPHVAEAWGIDQDDRLLGGARQRAQSLQLDNVRLVEGNATNADDVAQLPDGHFNLALSQRGPNINAALAAKLAPDALFIQEFVSNFDAYPLKELFGRKHYAHYWFVDQDVILSQYAELDLFPISNKEYFYEAFFRDTAHLEAYLKQIPALLSNWRLPPNPYDAEHDRAALELYVRYNTTPRGIRLLRQRKIFVLRRTPVTYYPVDAAS